MNRSRPRPRLLLAACLLALASPAGADGLPDPHAARELRRSPVVRVFEQTRDAVVNIACIQVVQPEWGINDRFNPFFDRRVRPDRLPRHREIIGVGSGFVIHADGYVITNAHVVMKTADQRVIFADGSEYEARPVSVDGDSDLAVLKIEANRPLPALKLGRSDDLMIGETVVAIGNPLGYRHTLTTGVVSALDRSLRFANNVEIRGLIQTDASINPGNSGGPLFNVLGELIGVNTAIRGDAENIGFAIPVDQLRRALPDMLSLERLKRVRAGLRVAGAPQVEVVQVEASGPAAQAGVRHGDRLVSLDGQPVLQDVDVLFHLLAKDAGDPVSLALERSGQRIETRFALREIPVPDGAQLVRNSFGMEIAPLTGELARALELDRGFVVEKVVEGGQADRAGIQPGMVILTIAGVYPRDLNHVGLLLENVRPGETVLFHVWQVTSRGRGLLIRSFEIPLRAR